MKLSAIVDAKALPIGNWQSPIGNVLRFFRWKVAVVDLVDYF